MVATLIGPEWYPHNRPFSWCRNGRSGGQHIHCPKLVADGNGWVCCPYPCHGEWSDEAVRLILEGT